MLSIAVLVSSLATCRAVNLPFNSPASSCVISVPNPRLASCFFSLSQPNVSDILSRSATIPCISSWYLFFKSLDSSLSIPSLSAYLLQSSYSSLILSLYCFDTNPAIIAFLRLSSKLSHISSKEVLMSAKLSMKPPKNESYVTPVIASLSDSFSSTASSLHSMMLFKFSLIRSSINPHASGSCDIMIYNSSPDKEYKSVIDVIDLSSSWLICWKPLTAPTFLFECHSALWSFHEAPARPEAAASLCRFSTFLL
ncbi:hypothetical protein EVA_03115 [gut metagenome]|uniref:Uncharacterized protein n=1 Tax=gut metagenome TaxID=749906 RepID=J9D7L8_9ZZZZ